MTESKEYTPSGTEGWKAPETGESKEQEKRLSYGEIAEKLQQIVSGELEKDLHDDRTTESNFYQDKRMIHVAKEHGFDVNFCPVGVASPFQYQGEDKNLAAKVISGIMPKALASNPGYKVAFSQREKMLDVLEKIDPDVKRFRGRWKQNYESPWTYGEDMYEKAIVGSGMRLSKEFYNLQVKYCNLQEAARRGIIQESEIPQILRSEESKYKRKFDVGYGEKEPDTFLFGGLAEKYIEEKDPLTKDIMAAVATKRRNQFSDRGSDEYEQKKSKEFEDVLRDGMRKLGIDRVVGIIADFLEDENDRRKVKLSKEEILNAARELIRS